MFNPTDRVKVMCLTGAEARTCLAAEALATLADMIGYQVSTLAYTNCPNPGFVSHWSFNDCGSIVGRVELRS